MKIDCSKQANKGDLVAIILATATIVCAVTAAVLSYYAYEFIGGVLASAFVLKFNVWIYEPVDRFVDWLWAAR